MRRIQGSFAFGLLVVAACASVSAPAPGELARGTWGGENAAVMVTDSVTHVHVGCTFGNIAAVVPLDADGRFTVNGSYVLRAYPVFIGPELPAQFTGQVVGRTLTLAVAVNDTVEKKVVALGPVTVMLGREPNMGPCPICALVRPGRYGSMRVSTIASPVGSAAPRARARVPDVQSVLLEL